MLFLKKVTLALALFGHDPSYEQLVAEKPLQGQIVVVDPGHGGQNQDCPCYNPHVYTGGAFGKATRQSESDVNLRVSFYLKKYLEAMGAEVVLTREDRCRITTHEKSIELGERVNIANRANGDLFISIHHNDSPKPFVNYSVVFYNKSHIIHSTCLSKWVLYYIDKDLKVPAKGIVRGNYKVLSDLKMPGILVEASFMSNYEEDKKLASHCWRPERGAYYYEYNDVEAFAIAKGIAMYRYSLKYTFIKAPSIEDVSDIFLKKVTKAKKKVTTKKNKRKK